MRRWTSLALPAVLLLAAWSAGSLAQTGGGDNPAPTDKQSKPNQFGIGWLNPFGRSNKDQQKPADNVAAEDGKKPAGPTLVESAAERMAREQEVYFRRQAVCAKIKNIAIATNNEMLERMADQLDQRIYAIYCQRTGAAATVPEDAAPTDSRTDSSSGPRPGRILPSAFRDMETSGPSAARKDRP